MDISIAKNFQLGAYANYGQINLSQNSSNIGGGSWNPSVWGGGIKADWWTETFYVQGLLSGTGFSVDKNVRSFRLLMAGVMKQPLAINQQRLTWELCV